MARKGFSELVVDTTSKHHAVLLQYRTKCFRQGLTLPAESKQQHNATYVPFLGGELQQNLVGCGKELQEDMSSKLGQEMCA
jgi:hypothetical protein